MRTDICSRKMTLVAVGWEMGGGPFRKEQRVHGRTHLRDEWHRC